MIEIFEAGTMEVVGERAPVPMALVEVLETMPAPNVEEPGQAMTLGGGKAIIAGMLMTEAAVEALVSTGPVPMHALVRSVEKMSDLMVRMTGGMTVIGKMRAPGNEAQVALAEAPVARIRATGDLQVQSAEVARTIVFPREEEAI